jgi:hypothetical protein
MSTIQPGAKKSPSQRHPASTGGPTATGRPSAPGPLFFNVDEFRIEADAFGAGIVVRLAGWAFDADARDPLELQLRCDGTVLYELSCSNVRSDIAPAAPDLVESSSLPLCGFEDKYHLEEERGLFSLYSPAHERVLIEGHFNELGGAEATRQAGPGKRRFPWATFLVQLLRPLPQARRVPAGRYHASRCIRSLRGKQPDPAPRETPAGASR